MTEIVAHWGVHDAEGIRFLEQAESTNALGLSIPSPFRVRLTRKSICNHNIPLHLTLDQGVRFLLDHNLVRVMLPLPKTDEKVIYFVDEGWVTPVLATLQRLSSPVAGIVRPYWQRRTSEWMPELETTNVQPLVLTGIEPRHTPHIRRLAQAAAGLPRRLVLVGHAGTGTYPPIEKVRPEPIELPNVSWEEIGGAVLAEWMRGNRHAA